MSAFLGALEERRWRRTGGSPLNRIGNPLVIPKPLICIEPENMNGFKTAFLSLFSPTQPRSIAQMRMRQMCGTTPTGANSSIRLSSSRGYSLGDSILRWSFSCQSWFLPPCNLTFLEIAPQYFLTFVVLIGDAWKDCTSHFSFPLTVFLFTALDLN